MNYSTKTKKELISEIKKLRKNKSLCLQSNSMCLLERMALETSVNAISFADLRGKVSYVNKAFLHILGYKSKKEVLGRHTSDFWMSKKESAKMRKALFADGNWVGEMQARKKDGNPITIRLSANVVKDKNKRPLCTMACFDDISEVQNTLEALAESEQKYKSFIERAAEGIVIADVKNKKFKFVNPAICRILGYSEEELLKMGVRDIHPKESLKHVLSEFKRQASGERSLAPSLPCLCKDGRIIYADVNAAKIIIDGEECNIGFFTDITERRIAEEKLKKANEELEIRVERRTAELKKTNVELRKEIEERKSADRAREEAEQRFRGIFENALIGIYRTTPSGDILMANPALIKMLGYNSFKELEKRNINKDGFEPDYPRSFFKNEIEKKGRIEGLESIWKKLDGTRLHVLESALAIKDNKGKILYYEGTVEDITKRKEAEEQLMIYQKQLRSLALELSLSEERMRRQMAMNIHDHMGQNLAFSKLKLDSLRKSISSPDVKTDIDQVRELIAQTIEAVRSLTFELSPPVLYELGFVPAVQWLVRHMKDRNNIPAEFVDDNRAKPLDDNVRVLLFQSVRESLTNIVKHAHAKNVRVELSRADNKINISIIDDGVGFDVSKVLAGDLKAEGFGLFSISERLRFISGTFDINSKPGKGTCVKLSAPLVVNKKVKKKRGRKK